MRINNRLMVAAASVCMLGTISAHANLVTDGTFDDHPGLAPDWGSLPIAGISPTGGIGGTQAGLLGPAVGTIAQFVPVVAGQQYILDFFAKDNGGSLNLLTITLGFLPTDIVAAFDPTSAYKEYTYTVTAPASGVPLSFVWLDTVNSAFIDNVSLTAVPEPSTYIAGGLLLLPFGASILRRLRNAQTV